MTSLIVVPYAFDEAEALKELYYSVGWLSYFRRPGLLEEAYSNSLKVFAAYDGERLVGVIRSVGDGVSILYVQDLIVHPEYQRRGIGTALLKEMLDCFPDVNQTVLLTDDTESMRCFYEAAGFQQAENVGCCSFIRLHSCYG